MMRLGKRSFKIIRYILLILFLGYFGSTTLFVHTHHIENGIIIVHSHPFKSGPVNNPFNHQHSSNGFLLLQAITGLLTVFSFTIISAEALRTTILKVNFKKSIEKFSDTARLLPYGLRAPPFKYTA